MRTPPMIRPDVRRQFEQITTSLVETPILVKTFDPAVDSRRPLDAVLRESEEIRAYCIGLKLPVAMGDRHVGNHLVRVVNQFMITPDQACAILGGDAETRLHESRRRRDAISFFELEDVQYAVFYKQTAKLPPEIFDGITMIARYIREHPGLNIHQRTIALPGIDTKFVETYRNKIEMLLDEGEFQLKDHRTTEIIVCYRDPMHMANSARHCDVIIPGYSDTPFEYVPKTILVCENKHSAMFVTPRPGLISMMGVGHSAASRIITELRISNHPYLIYWGDLDIEGMSILANIRKAGIKVRSICMDANTAKTFAHYDVEPKHNSNIHVNPVFLTKEERVALRMLTTGKIRRIEQEKLPEEYVTAQLDSVLRYKNQ